ncbi:GHKL domain-containing protein [bacterium SCSIO 12741]|nr:GHKL domain-containing protein [bacterium SCSIO 12741]
MRSLQLFFTLLLLSFQSSAQVVIQSAEVSVPIGLGMEYMEDVHGLPFEDASLVETWTPCDNEVPNLGLSTHGFWTRFTLRNETDERNLKLLLAYPMLDEVEFYAPDSNGKYTVKKVGESLPFAQREVVSPNFIFQLDLPKNQEKTYYLRVKSLEQIILPIRVTSQELLWTDLNWETAINGLYSGIILIMVFYNLFVYFSVRDKNYIFYVLYVLFVGLTQLGIKGELYGVFWPNYPEFQSRSLILFGNFGALFGVIFARDFLRTRQFSRILDNTFLVLIAIFIFSLGFTLMGNLNVGFQLMQSGTGFSAITIFIATFLSIKAGMRSARFFLVAWSILLVGSIVFLLKDFGILPYNSLTNYAMQAASAIEMSLLSFALADKINQFRIEKEESRARELVALKENEKLIREQNIVLEKKVSERTQELQSTNENLEVAMDNLKSAQAQLVNQEKMASLGQLTAGIAHEINNPINFVSSNVKPLKRDIEDLLEVIEKYDELDGAESVEELVKEIKEFKEEIDYDFVVEEINQLLNGIGEGASRTAEIVKSLRNFSRLDEVESKVADVHEGLDSTLVILSSIMEKHIDLVKNYDLSIEPIECHPGKLNQVFSNILVNAIQAMNEMAEENSQIIISTKNLDDKIRISIADTGPGIPDEAKEHIFEPFFTTKDVGEGTGLGLSIVFSIIEAHNGTIELGTERDKGAEFVITLPKTLTSD